MSALAAVMLAMSCSEKDNPAPETETETPNEVWLVGGYTKMLNIDSILIDTTHTQFHYNSDGTLKGTTWYNPGNADSMWQYSRNTYADGRLVKIEEKDDDKEWVTYKEFEYENALHTRTIYNERVDLGDTLIYNSAGKLVEVNNYDVLGNGMQWKLTWDGANISQMEFIMHSPEMVKSLGIYY